ncbi:hypothetical protein Tco_0834967 [Tanacetum coccineum]
MMNKNFLDMMRQIQSVKSVSPKCETYGGSHSFTECPAIDGYTQEAAYAPVQYGLLPTKSVFLTMDLRFHLLLRSPDGSGTVKPRRQRKDIACEEYAQEVLGFSDSSTKIETFLRTLEELSNLDEDYYDTEGDILYLEKLLNEDPSSNLPPMKNDDLKQVYVTMTKPLIEEPTKLELKDLASHLEYAF